MRAARASWAGLTSITTELTVTGRSAFRNIPATMLPETVDNAAHL